MPELPAAPAPVRWGSGDRADLPQSEGVPGRTAVNRATEPRSLRVAFCIDNMNVGGTELNALRTARHLVEQGISLSVFSLSEDGPLVERYAELEVPIHFLPIRNLYGWHTLRRGRELASTVHRERIQVVHAHDFYSNIFAAPWTRLAGAAFVASRRWWDGPDRRAQRWANRLSYVVADRVLANSEAVAELLRRVERVAGAKIVVVRNFVEDTAFQPPGPAWIDAFAAELQLPPQRLVVGAVASLLPIKDHATLLRAVARLAPGWPTLYLVLVGADGGCRAELERLARQLGIADRVRFAGLRPNIPSAHWLFDISVLTSVSEGLPNSLLEAMAAGRPVVATRVGAVPDAVVDGETGALVAPGDDVALASQLGALLASPESRRGLGEAGRLRALEHYSVRPAVDRTMALYHGLARRQSRVGAHG